MKDPHIQALGYWARYISNFESFITNEIITWHLQRHGNGNMVYFCGNQYVGSWENDTRTGRGCLTYKTGQIYDGDWKDDRPSKCQFFPPNALNLNFINTPPDGNGIFIYNDGGSAGGSKYEGNLVAGLREGKVSSSAPSSSILLTRAFLGCLQIQQWR